MKKLLSACAVILLLLGGCDSDDIPAVRYVKVTAVNANPAASDIDLYMHYNNDDHRVAQGLNYGDKVSFDESTFSAAPEIFYHINGFKSEVDTLSTIAANYFYVAMLKGATHSYLSARAQTSLSESKAYLYIANTTASDHTIMFSGEQLDCNGVSTAYSMSSESNPCRLTDNAGSRSIWLDGTLMLTYNFSDDDAYGVVIREQSITNANPTVQVVRIEP